MLKLPAPLYLVTIGFDYMTSMPLPEELSADQALTLFHHAKNAIAQGEIVEICNTERLDIHEWSD